MPITKETQKINHPQELNVDLLVVGGGLAGCIAAIAAKRTEPQAEVWLVERYGFLGGMATAGYVFPFMGYATRDPVTKVSKRLIGGIFEEIIDEMHELGYTEKRRLGDTCYSRFDPMMMRCVLDRRMEKAGVKVLFHGMMNSVETQRGAQASGSGSTTGNIIKTVVIQTRKYPITFHPKVVIDATGNADVIYHSNAEFEQGREVDGLTQPATLNFRLGNVGILTPPRSQWLKKIKAEKESGNPLTPRDNALIFMSNNPKERHFNQTRVAGFDFTDPFELTAAELEGRKQAERFIQFTRTKIMGYKHSTVVGLGTELGLRESRRMVGDYCLTEQDLLNCVQFEDRIALGNYSIDIHDPKGSATTQIQRIPKGKWYSIPYRSLLPKNLLNCLVVGRPISSTHVAHSAIRVMPICSGIGHGGGVAAGLLIQKLKSEAKEVNAHSLEFTLIQNELRRQKAVLE